MRTIDTILEYNFNPLEIEGLLSSGIINGCGWSWGFKFDNIVPIIIEEIKKIKGFNPKKLEKFINDVKKICYEHDIDFRLKRGFYYSNFKFAFKLYKLLKKWVSRKKRIWIAFFAFTLLNIWGKKYYFLK